MSVVPHHPITLGGSLAGFGAGEQHRRNRNRQWPEHRDCPGGERLATGLLVSAHTRNECRETPLYPHGRDDHEQAEPR